MLITKLQIQKLVYSYANVRISEDFYSALNQEVENIIKKAIYRAKENNRTTIMARDI